MKADRSLQSAGRNLAPGVLLALAAAVRFYRIGTQSLWNDEGNSAVMAARSFALIARNASHDIHPPLYYWLLHVWSSVFGHSEAALRSLSAIFGIFLVWWTFEIANELLGRKEAVAAAAIVAASPLAIYYSQEARMYMMLAAVISFGVYLLVKANFAPGKSTLALVAGTIACGLYTHYTFPLAWLAVALTWLWKVRKDRKGIFEWSIAHLAALLLFLPWLPTAMRQVTTWPRSNAAVPLLHRLLNSWKWIAGGPLSPAEPEWLWFLLAAILALGIIRKFRYEPAVWLWFSIPFGAVLLPGLYKPSYLKFLVSALMPWSVLMAAGTFPLSKSNAGRSRLAEVAGSGALILVLAGFAMGDYAYFTNPKFARDDYRGMARYIEAVERPGDAIILDAPGQVEVFRYYYHGKLPIYPLPSQRPPDEKATISTLNRIVGKHNRVFALYWATDESDPHGIVEKFLASHGFKSIDRWRGNVRFVVYALPEKSPNLAPKGVLFGDLFELRSAGLYPSDLHAGDILQVFLQWKALHATKQRYKVSVQVLDSQNQVVAQQDGEPAGGSKPTNVWKQGEEVNDLHGVLIPFGTPPGDYRVYAVVYGKSDGRRLKSEQGDMLLLGRIHVSRPAAPPPEEIIGFEHKAGIVIHGARLLGFDSYKKGFSYAPETPIHPGDVLHITLYWKAIEKTDINWKVSIWLQGKGKKINSVEGYPAGPGFPPVLWKAGDLLKGEFDIIIPKDASPGIYDLRISSGERKSGVTIGRVKVSR